MVKRAVDSGDNLPKSPLETIQNANNKDLIWVLNF